MSGWSIPVRVCYMLIALVGAKLAMAGEIHVQVLDVNGQPVADVAVFVKQAGTAAESAPSPASAEMDQRDVLFVPHILVVQKGASVEFPNSDVVAHHVYSFSRPNSFVLPLYKGTPPTPEILGHEGVVVLGCNIHDGMLGYILIVDTHVFGKTDSNGKLSLTVDDSATNYEINIWSPRIKDSKDPIVQSMATIPSEGITFKLQKSLRPAHIDQSDAVAWDEY